MVYQDDFCLWGGPQPGSLIGNVEAAVVAFCSKPGHGARLMTFGTLSGVQVNFTANVGSQCGLISMFDNSS